MRQLIIARKDLNMPLFTKTICEAKNRNQLMKAVVLAQEQGLVENQDFFLIRDNCLTELEPEEMGEDGIGRTLSGIGFRPLPDMTAHAISRKYQLFKYMRAQRGQVACVILWKC